MSTQKGPGSNIYSHYFVPLLVAGELAFAMTALTGHYWQQFRVAVILLFVMFGCYSLYLALDGARSCGCFGQVRVSPWWTFGLDLVIVTMLIAESWWENRSIKADLAVNFSHITQQRECAWITRIGGVCYVVFLSLVWQGQPVRDALNPLLQTVDNLTILDPESWPGKPFPLADAIDIDLMQGEWLVVLHQHDCPECQKVLPHYEELAKVEPGRRIAKVEVPPYSEDSELTDESCISARLRNDRGWFVRTPVELRLSKGRVLQASYELPALRERESVGHDFQVSSLMIGGAKESSTAPE